MVPGQLRIVVDETTCPISWNPACPEGPLFNYSIPHLCTRNKEHRGRHVCSCKSWRPEDYGDDTGRASVQ